MPRRRRSLLSEQRVFFVTTGTKNRKRLFVTPEVSASLREIIAREVRRRNARLYGYVLMPSHIHLLVGLSGGGLELSAFMRIIKSLSWRLLFSDSPGIWMPRFDDVAIYSETQFRVKLNYIHNNPVKAGLAKTPEEYPYSSALAWSGVASDNIVTTTIEC